MEDYQVKWTPGAIVQLDEIALHIAEDSPQSAQRVEEGILKRAANLARFPLLGEVYRARGRIAARQITYKKYRIFYRVKKSARRVEILSIWHSARREPPLA